MVGERFDRIEIRDIAFDHRAFLGIVLGTLPALVPNGGGGLFQRFSRASAEDGVRAEFGEGQGDGSANAASGAGDDRELSGQWQVRR